MSNKDTNNRYRVTSGSGHMPTSDNVYLDIFDAEGKYIARFPSKVNPRIWKNNKIFERFKK